MGKLVMALFGHVKECGESYGTELFDPGFLEFCLAFIYYGILEVPLVLTNYNTNRS